MLADSDADRAAPKLCAIPASYPLVAAHPELARTVEVVRLGNFPSPVKRMDKAEEAALRGQAGRSQSGGPQLFVKDDGCCCPDAYGGNKVRKLELLLAEALRSGAQELVTFGTAGSHSVLAAVTHTVASGLQASAFIAAQHPTPAVAKNMVRLSRQGSKPGTASAEVRYCESGGRLAGAVLGKLFSSACSQGRIPFVCPPGATSVQSTIGYVNAMYELAVDVTQRHSLPQVPKRIYVPGGSGGTYIGVLIGCKAIDLFREAGTRVISVRSGTFRPLLEAKDHFDSVVARLRALTGGSFPSVTITEEELATIADYSFQGEGYGVPSFQGEESRQLFSLDGVELDPTYTAKAAARVLWDFRSESAGCGAAAEVWVFWNTNHQYDAEANPAMQVETPPTQEDMDNVKKFLPSAVVDKHYNDEVMALSPLQ